MMATARQIVQTDMAAVATQAVAATNSAVNVDSSHLELSFGFIKVLSLQAGGLPEFNPGCPLILPHGRLRGFYR